MSTATCHGSKLRTFTRTDTFPIVTVSQMAIFSVAGMKFRIQSSQENAATTCTYTFMYSIHVHVHNTYTVLHTGQVHVCSYQLVSQQ